MTSPKPTPEDSSSDPTAVRILHVAAVVMALAGFALAALLSQDNPVLSLRVQLHVGIGAVGLVSLFLLRSGRPGLAGSIMIWGYWLGATIVAAINGGLRGPNLINYPLILVISGWLLGGGQTIVLALLTEVVFIVFLAGDSYGLIPPSNFENLPAYFVFLTAITAMTAAATCCRGVATSPG